jgi:GMP synthase (glutamine-hydrolysing)
MRVLSVVHDPSRTGGGGLFETVAAEAGHAHERWVAPNGSHEADPAAYDAIMVFGGAMHPDQDAEHPWLPDEAAFIGAALEARVPLLGVCLGSQLIARAAGAAVGPAATAEVGWFPVELTDAGRADPVLGTLPRRVEAFEWHYYTFEVPTAGTLLATSDAASQAYRIDDHAWGIQFHAEVTREMLENWFVTGEPELPRPIADLRAETDRLIGPWNRHGRALCEAFLETAARQATGRLGSFDHSCHEPG